MADDLELEIPAEVEAEFDAQLDDYMNDWTAAVGAHIDAYDADQAEKAVVAEALRKFGRAGKARKDGVGYVYVPEADGRYQCPQCPWFIADKERCALLRKDDVARAIGTCTYWVFGPSAGMTEPIGLLTPEQAGYMENKPGFSCGRCAVFSPDEEKCADVDENSEGDTPGKIVAGACCGEWTRPEKQKLLAIGPLQKRAGVAPSVVRAAQQLERSIAEFLRDTGRQIAEKVRALAPAKKVAKAGKQSAAKVLDQILPIDWSSLVPDLVDNLQEIARAGAARGLGMLEITDTDLIRDANDRAADWAHDHAAELVGMKWVNGRLRPNPDAKWRIDQPTRDAIERIVEDAFERQTDMRDLADEIQAAGAFSESRARMIAKTEVARTEHQGNLAGWKASGLVEAVDWQLSADHETYSCNCADNADGSPYELDEVPEFPDHPNCECALVIHRLAGEPNEEEH